MQEIFFVHDQQESAATRKSFLEMSGYKVTAMRTAAECLDLLAVRKPALVLIDVLIDGPNGFEACKRIREKHKAAELPIILGSTIYRSRVYRDAALQAGAQRYLLRPIKLDELVKHVSDAVAGRAAPSEAA
jgi:DNA-binding response OmpR family regulator